ncbi:M16 family metallopeptidase [Ornithinimicrobium faecis]|uniref:Insulinase family protein n=1 Tax=Ornithinimicrobium faecis TaxID=2934158 RepID=A0ABY4YQ13_9MICO|nr:MULTISPECIES: pitrilysin family protein [unclassified Ornithinimicrobium]USQ78841.1 insulinase family protein [Ornithinimicrobium sp. HY1793]
MPLDYPIATRTLNNGLRVVVSPDHTVPTVTVNIWVGVGSRHERPGSTGLAHLFEHLMFQGSANVEEGEHFSLLMEQGGTLNATTWFDRTNYFETVPTGALDLALWLEADRHGRLLDAVNQANLDNQRDVVKEEKRQRYDNQPYGTAIADLGSLVFPEGHPYHHPTIGSMEDLDAAALEDVHAFYRQHYTPANTVLTLVGDITVEEGFAAVARHFDPLHHAAPEPQPRGAQLSPLTQAPRLERVEEVPNDRLYLGFRLPVAHTPEFIACSVALDALASLMTSRLYRRLVRTEEVATSVSGASLGLVDGASLGFLGVDVATGADSAAVEAAVCAELEKFALEGPTAVELESSLADTERSWLEALAGHQERADLISHYALLHEDPEHINTYLDTVRAVTADQVRDAAARWLVPDARATVAFRAVDEEPQEVVA